MRSQFVQSVWGARIPSVSRINARRLRGNRNDLIAHGLSNLLVVEPATALRVSSRGHEPKIKPAQDRFDFWLGRTQGSGDVPTSVWVNLRFTETRTKR